MRSVEVVCSGPVFAGAVVVAGSALEPLARPGLTDSKRSRPAIANACSVEFTALAPGLRDWGPSLSQRKLIRHGIRWATEAAMRGPCNGLPPAPVLCWSMGVLPLRTLVWPAVTWCRVIAVAWALPQPVVLAKQARDGLVRAASRFPGYGLERHCSPMARRLHRALARARGHPLHRQSFLSGCSVLPAPGLKSSEAAAGRPRFASQFRMQQQGNDRWLSTRCSRPRNGRPADRKRPDGLPPPGAVSLTTPNGSGAGVRKSFDHFEDLQLAIEGSQLESAWGGRTWLQAERSAGTWKLEDVQC